MPIAIAPYLSAAPLVSAPTPIAMEPVPPTVVGWFKTPVIGPLLPIRTVPHPLLSVTDTSACAAGPVFSSAAISTNACSGASARRVVPLPLPRAISCATAQVPVDSFHTRR